MGLLGRVIAFSSGEIKAIECLTCGETYRSNISKEFPYAICGTCLESAQDTAQRNQDKQIFFEIDREFSRRCDLSGIKYQPKTFYVSGSDSSHGQNANISKSSKGRFSFGWLAAGIIFLIFVIGNSGNKNSGSANNSSPDSNATGESSSVISQSNNHIEPVSIEPANNTKVQTNEVKNTPLEKENDKGLYYVEASYNGREDQTSKSSCMSLSEAEKEKINVEKETSGAVGAWWVTVKKCGSSE